MSMCPLIEWSEESSRQLDSLAPKVRARRRDPETSHAAAKAFKSDTASRSVQVVCQLLKNAKRPVTDFEIAANWIFAWGGPFSESLPRKARHWAREAGLVEHAGFAIHNGRRVRTWRLKL